MVARARSKFYTWGWGERGQLGHGDFRNEVRIVIISYLRKL